MYFIKHTQCDYTYKNTKKQEGKTVSKVIEKLPAITKVMNNYKF